MKGAGLNTDDSSAENCNGLVNNRSDSTWKGALCCSFPCLVAGPLLHPPFPCARGAAGNLSEMCSTPGMGTREQGCPGQGSFWKLFGDCRRNQNSRNAERALPSCWHIWLCSYHLACRYWGCQGNQSPSLMQEC